jgi:hypothetical protein
LRATPITGVFGTEEEEEEDLFVFKYTIEGPRASLICPIFVELEEDVGVRV